MSLVPDGVRHGTDRAYSHYKCRCEACRARKREKNRKERDRRLSRAAVDPGSVPHGTAYGYAKFNCRCDECRKAGSEYQSDYDRRNPGRQQRYRADHADSVKIAGARRSARLQAGTAQGAARNGYRWTGPELELLDTRSDLSISELAELLGRTYHAVREARRSLKTDPRKDFLAGTPHTAQSADDQIH